MTRQIMEHFLAFIIAAAVVTALCALGFGIYDALRPATDWKGVRPAGPVTQPVRSIRVADLGAPCQKDGILITSMDRLRAAVTLADTMILDGGLRGEKISMGRVRDDADRFARLQVAPDVVLDQLARCDESLLQRYPHGYWMISGALVRESARRRNTSVHPNLLDPRAP